MRRTFLRMDDRVERTVCFLVWPLPEINGYAIQLPRGCRTIYLVHTTWYNHSPCAELRLGAGDENDQKRASKRCRVT